ncbi:hypothetical protein MRB53_016976 [Persea americana]|uniref:Uncharacterized protein n=1 Tax=Persea americana TaxID=3435 RepID=A0ACC2M3M7_PERAE|nr:hypothetical protein MRB53_016976 [Persea americana]
MPLAGWAGSERIRVQIFYPFYVFKTGRVKKNPKAAIFLFSASSVVGERLLCPRSGANSVHGRLSRRKIHSRTPLASQIEVLSRIPEFFCSFLQNPLEKVSVGGADACFVWNLDIVSGEIFGFRYRMLRIWILSPSSSGMNFL